MFRFISIMLFKVTRKGDIYKNLQHFQQIKFYILVHR